MIKLQLILQILEKLNYLSEFLPLLFCLLFFKKINSKEIKVFFVYITFSALLLTINLITKFKYANIVVSITVVFEFVLLSMMYFYIIKSSLVKKLIIFSIFLFAAYWIYNFSKVNLQGFKFDFLTGAVESLFFTAVIICYFYEVMQYNFTIPLFKLPSFWVSVAFLIFFSGSFFLILYSKTNFNKPGFRDQFLVIISVITIIKNILLCIALFENKNLVLNKDINPIPSNLNLDTFQPLNNQTNF